MYGATSQDHRPDRVPERRLPRPARRNLAAATRRVLLEVDLLVMDFACKDLDQALEQIRATLRERRRR